MLAQRRPQQVQMLPVGPGKMEAAGVHKMHLEISLAGLTARQQEKVLRVITDPAHPTNLYGFLSGGAGKVVNQGKPNARFQMLLPDQEPGMPAADQEAHLTASALIEGLVQEGCIEAAVSADEVYSLPVQYRDLQCAPGQVVLKIQGLTPEYAQVGVASMVLGCAGYPPEQAPVVREFMAPFPWSHPGNPVGNSGVVLAYVQYPVGDPCLKQLPLSFRLGPSIEVSLEVDTRGVNPVVPPPPPRQPSQPQGVPTAARGGPAGHHAPGQGQRQPQSPLGPAAVEGGGGESRGISPVPAGGWPPPPGLGQAGSTPPAVHTQPAGQGQPPVGTLGQPLGGLTPTAAAGPRALLVVGPEVAMGPGVEQGAATQQELPRNGPAPGTGWQGPTRSHPWQQPYGQQLGQAQQQQQQQPLAAVRGSLRPPDHPAVGATRTGLPPTVEAQAQVAYTAWRQTPSGGNWDSTVRDWLGDEGVTGEGLEGAMILFHEEHAPRLTQHAGPTSIAALPKWVVGWARDMGLVGSYGSGASSPVSSSRAPSETGSQHGEVGCSSGVGRRTGSRQRLPALRACDLPPTFHASQPHPSRGGGGSRP